MSGDDDSEKEINCCFVFMLLFAENVHEEKVQTWLENFLFSHPKNVHRKKGWNDRNNENG